MGYYVSSVTVISPDDHHSYFAYYLPTTRLRYEWINEFFTENFGLIADKIGPKGVIVAPTVGAAGEYSSELIRLMEAFDPIYRPSSTFLHAQFPFLVVSRGPIIADMPTSGELSDFVALNLAAVQDKAELSNLVDTLIQACLSEVKDILPLVSGLAKDLSKEYNDRHGGWSFAFSEALELKPNILGITVNINSVFKDMQRNIRAYRQRKISKEIGPL